MSIQKLTSAMVRVWTCISFMKIDKQLSEIRDKKSAYYVLNPSQYFHLLGQMGGKTLV